MVLDENIIYRKNMNYLVSFDKIHDKFNLSEIVKELQIDIKNTYNLNIDSIEGLFLNSKFREGIIPLSIDTKFLNGKLKKKVFNQIDNGEKNVNYVDGVCLNSDCSKGLKYLSKNYTNKVDCIYIDPPYNTGSSDFQYNDRIPSDKWQVIMNENLEKAYSLMKNDAVIFISIDDNELVQLRQICDKIFDRFIGMFVWHKKTQPSFLTKEFISVTEYILCYKKGDGQIKLKGGYTDPFKHTELLNISNDVTERILPANNTLVYNSGKKFSGLLKKGNYGNEKLQVKVKKSVNVNNGILEKDLQIIGRFRWRQEKINEIQKENRKIHIKSLKTLRPTVSGSGKRKIKAPISLLSKKINEMPTNTDANTEMKDLFKIPPKFSYPKPTKLIAYLIDCITYNKPNALVLDFFAGSGTTGQAVIELNKKNNSNIKFIMIEEAEHFDTILIPRMKKVLSCLNWKKGIPQEFNSTGGIIEYFKLK